MLLRLTICPILAPAALLLVLATPAHAGRPLSTDDAATAGASTCQVEAWHARTSAQRAWVLAPACSIGDSFEFGLEAVRPSPRDGTQLGGAVALKWVPSGATFDTPLGALALGAKLGSAFIKPHGAGWRRTDAGALALASLTPADRWSVFANAGTLRDRAAGVSATLLNVAAAYQPADTWLAFVETLASDRRAVLGGAVRGAGVRWWASKDQLGVDLTASRQAGGSSGTLWTVGVGWYGIKY